MPDRNKNEKNNFMIEKIKERPVNRKKLMRRTLTTAAMAVIFGLIACFTFLVIEPIISNWLYPAEQPQTVLFPEDTQEKSPEEMLSDTMQSIQNAQLEKEKEKEEIKVEKNETTEKMVSKDQVKRMLESLTLDRKNYSQLYASLYSFVKDMRESMVTITSTTSDVDWMNNVMESNDQVCGVIIANNKIELLILSQYSPIKKAEKFRVTFEDSTQVTAVIKQYDERTDLAILAVSLTDLQEDFIEDVQIAELGSTMYKNITGTPVIALGSPMGNCGSIGYGIIAGENTISDVDSEFKLLQTDIYGSQKAGGVLFDLQGKLVGVIVNGKNGSDLRNLISAYGISDLRKIIEKMSNGMSYAYLGIKGMDVSYKANTQMNVPLGTYVKEVTRNSPAMLAGIQQGDIIVKIGKSEIKDFDNFESALMSAEPGKMTEIVLMRQSQQEYKEMTLSIILGESGKED